MKRYLLILLAVLTAGIALANSYFAMGDGLKLRIHPNKVTSTVTLPVWAHFEGRLDYWDPGDYRRKHHLRPSGAGRDRRAA